MWFKPNSKFPHYNGQNTGDHQDIPHTCLVLDRKMKKILEMFRRKDLELPELRKLFPLIDDDEYVPILVITHGPLFGIFQLILQGGRSPPEGQEDWCVSLAGSIDLDTACHQYMPNRVDDSYLQVTMPLFAHTRTLHSISGRDRKGCYTVLEQVSMKNVWELMWYWLDIIPSPRQWKMQDLRGMRINVEFAHSQSFPVPPKAENRTS